VCHELGPVGAVQVEDVEAPTHGPGQVIVDVEAAGVSFVDALLVGGRYQFPIPVPFVPGGEVAGRISAVGAGVDGVRVGDFVVAQPMSGGFAERIVLSSSLVASLPEGISAPVAATMLQSYCTAVYELTRRDPVKAGETVLVLGAGGGVGLATIDVAAGLGATVIAAASTPEKRAAALDAGAVAVIDTTSEDLKVRARELSGGGVNVVVDPVGGELAEPALRALGFGGRYHVVGFAAGVIPRIPLNLVLLNSRTVVGVELGGVLPHEPELAAQLRREVISGVADGRYRPVVPATLPLSSAGAALEALLERRVTGKLALVMGSVP
jgi:NADPH:quinone reductase